MTTKASYNEWHDRYDVDRGDATPWHRLVLSHIDPERDLRGKRVIEVACGRGGFAAKLSALTAPAPRLVAGDLSSAAVSKGKASADRAPLGWIGWEVVDAQSLSHAGASFDTAISCETIEHLPDPRAALAELFRVLKPGGRLLLTTPNYLGPMGLYRGYARLRGRPYTEEGQPINNFMMLPLTVAWVKRAGFRIVAVDASGHYLPWPGRPPRELSSLEAIRSLRWLALHSLVVAEKRAGRVS